MTTDPPAHHWDEVFSSRRAQRASWHQDDPAVSLRLVEAHAGGPDAAVVDAGAGESLLVDRLLERGYTDLTVLDVSRVALDAVAARLGEAAARVRFVVADLTTWVPDRRHALWHDRGHFHFLVDPDDRARYVGVATAAVAPGGHLVVATFAADGPTHCSGLPVRRCDAGILAADFRPAFEPVAAEREIHLTPTGDPQPWTWGVFRRVAGGPGA